MSATLEDVTKRKPEPSAEQLAAEELVRQAREQGLSLTGPDGLLKQMTKTVLETALDEELTEHLGHEKHGQVGNETGQRPATGSRSKTVLTEGTGQVGIEVPRDRDGTFEPQMVKKRQRRLNGVDEIVLSLYAKGLTTGRDLGALRGDLRRLGLEGDGQPDHRPGHRGDASPGGPGRWMRSTRRSSSTRSWSRCGTGRSATGPSTPRSGSPWPGRRTCWACGPAIGRGGRRSSGCAVLTDLRNRGVKDVFFVVCDGLKGLPDGREHRLAAGAWSRPASST